MKILDCTLRDGGYYNEWDFSRPLIEKYLRVMSLSKIDYVELGLRTPASGKFLGPCAYTTEGFLRSLSIPAGLVVGVMVNTKEFNTVAHLAEFFVPRRDSAVGLVRVASHLNEVEKSIEFVRYLKSQGYQTGLNLMQIGEQEPAAIGRALALINQCRELDVLYFADSLGNMGQEEIAATVKLIRESYKGPLGIHAHNNMGQALTNTMAALKLGVEWLDCTVLGMGRGAGNTQTELLLSELEELGHKVPLEPLYMFVLDDFSQLKTTYQWGPDLLYHLAAKHSIHPTYIQLLKTEGGLDSHDIINALSVLKRVESTSYKRLDLNQLIYSNTTRASDIRACVIPEMEKRDVLLIANGTSLAAHRDEVLKFAQKNNLFVVSLNPNHHVSTKAIDLHVLCNPGRLLANMDRLAALDSLLLIPASRLNADIRQGLQKAKVYDYDLNLGTSIAYSKEGCTLPAPLVLGYALSFLASAGKQKIYTAGLDGHASSEANAAVNALLETFQQREPQLKLLSITPSHFKIAQRSLHERGMLYEV